MKAMIFNRSRLMRIAWWTLGSLAAYATIGFLVLPPIVKTVLTNQLSGALHRAVTVQELQINPFVLSARIGGFSVKDRNGEATFLGFEELVVDAQMISLVKGGPVLREVRLKAPRISIVRNQDKTYNFSDLLETFGSKPDAAPAPEEAKPLRFSINNIQLDAGRVEFEDKPKAAHHTFRDIQISIPFLSNLPYEVEIFVQPAFEAIVNDTPFRLAGKTKPFHETFETILDVNVSDIAIPKYLAYLPVELPIRVISGMVGLQAELSFIRTPGKPSTLGLTGQMELKDLIVTDEVKRPLLALPQITVGIQSPEILARKVHFASVVVQSAEVHVRRDRAGTLNVMALGPKPSVAQPVRTPGEQQSRTETPPLLLEVDKAEVRSAKIHFVDETTTPAVRATVEQLDLGVSRLSTEKNSKAEMTLKIRLDKTGKLDMTGSIGATPPSAKLKADIKDVDLVPFWPYVSDRLNVILTRGLFTTKGDLEFGVTPEQRPAISFEGETGVTKFTLLDRGGSEELLKWSALSLKGVRMQTEPLKVDVQEVALADFYSRLIIHPDGTLNVQGLIKQQGAPSSPTAAKPAPAPAPIGIKMVTIQGGKLDFTDRFVKPHFTARMTKLGGKIAGMSSEENRRAEVEFRGQFRDESPLVISGTINPLKRDLFADIRMDFKDIELSPMTPYAARYAGYSIQKGKLSVSLNYHIENRKLSADHHLYIDQFSFGEKTDSPDATSLPVRLAVALLQDRHGVIDLNFPVSGSLDDPEFSVWGVIMKIVKNLVVKAATSPFALVKGLVGEDVELSHLEFDFGQAKLPDAAAAKLNALAKVLTERPALSVDLIGHADIERDRDGLRHERLAAKIKTQKLNELKKLGEPGLSLDMIEIAPHEYEDYLSKAYKQETFPKPKNLLGLDKSLPALEMEKLILIHLNILDDDLRQLARERAQAVKDFMVTSGKIEPQRLFLVEARALAPEPKERVKTSRVDFELR